MRQAVNSWEPESVIAGRFMLRLNEMLAAYDITEREYLDEILPHIPAARMFDYDFVHGYVLARHRGVRHCH